VKIWFDTEFDEDGFTIDLISIGAVREDGATYYAETQFDPYKVNSWVRDNVLPHLHGPVKPRPQIAKELVEFAGPEPEFWAYYADYDWVALCQLYGPMLARPAGWPMFCRDVQQVADEARVRLSELHPQTGVEHHALADALWLREADLELRRVLRDQDLARTADLRDMNR
jgi:3'-5' exoribonuclease-like protein